MKKETIKRIISSPTVWRLSGARRGAMMLLTTLLFTLTAQTAWADNVASVTVGGNTTNYSSLDAAISAARSAYIANQSPATVTLNSDITEQPCSLSIDKPMIIDLNGHTIGASNLPSYCYGIFYISSSAGKVTFKNGTIRRNLTTIYNNYNSEVELENITARNTTSSGSTCIDNRGTLTISKGITLSGIVSNSGTVKIASGQTLRDNSENEYTGTLDSSQITTLGNNTLTLLVVASVTVGGNTTDYSSLDAAISAASEGSSVATVTLLQDLTQQTCSLRVSKQVIIDLNGHRITNQNHSPGYILYFNLNTGGKVIVKNGTLRSSSGSAIFLNSGNVEFENVTVENTYSSNSSCISKYGGTLTISKGITLTGSIYNSNSGTVKIADGQTLYDNSGNSYTGTLSSSQIEALKNNTLRLPAVTVTVGGNTLSYNSLDAAISAARSAYTTYQSPATVTLNSDITEQPCSLYINKPMIIDLNGHTIGASNLPSYCYGIFYISSSAGKVTFKNGTIRRNLTTIYNSYSSEVELENITARNTTSSGSTCIDNRGTLTISKGITLSGIVSNSGTVKIASGQTLYDNSGHSYTGILSSSQITALSNNTLIPPVATVTVGGSTTDYRSLDTAISAACSAYTTYQSPATVTLNSDITEQPCSLYIDKPMIIDLNGHIIGAGNLAYAYGIFYISYNAGKVTFKNGTIRRNDTAIYNSSGAEVELENITAENTASSSSTCIDNHGTFTISKGITLIGRISNSGTVKIADDQALYDNSGNEYTGTLSSSQITALGNNTLIPPVATVTTSSGTATYRVGTNGSAPDLVLWSAVNAASSAYTSNNPATVTLCVDITELTCSLRVNKPMIIDLNGHTINSTSRYNPIYIDITDNTENATVKNGSVRTNNYAIDMYRGEVELENVTVENIEVSNNGTVTLNYTAADNLITIIGSVNRSGNGTVKVADGKKMSDGTNVFVGTISNLSLLENKTLMPAYTVTFDENGGDPVANQTVASGATISNPGSPWTGHTATWKKGEEVYDFSTPVTEDFTLKAYWTANTYTVSFDANGGSGATMANQDFTYDVYQYLTANTYTAPTNYRFAGWNTAANGSGMNYENGAWVGNLTTENGATVTLYAQWKKDFTKCTAIVPNQLQNGFYIGYNFEGGEHGGIKVYDGETLLTYGTDYNIGAAKSYDYKYDEDPCTHENEHCYVTLEGTGAYTGELTADFVILPTTGGDTWGGLTWSYADGTLSITGTGAMDAADNYYEYPWYDYCSSITIITIGEGITSIAAKAFGGTYLVKPYASVTTVNLPESLKTIGDNAFAFCTGATFNADDLITQGVTYGENSFNQVGCLVGTLADNANNTDKIALLNQAWRANVTLSGRTLWKDGAWNTLVLPFDIVDINAKEDDVYTCPLHGATVMELDVTDNWAIIDGNWEIDNVKGTSQTGLVDGTLNLFFKETTSITAGKPYIIKWASGDNLVNPVFNGVPVSDANHNVTSTDDKVAFKGTYAPMSWNTEDRSILFVGADNNLHWPQAGASLGAFRAYFELADGQHAREFVLNFGSGSEETSISPAEIKEIAESADAWYSLDGLKLNGKPTKKGLYIVNGKKIVIK